MQVRQPERRVYRKEIMDQERRNERAEKGRAIAEELCESLGFRVSKDADLHIIDIPIIFAAAAAMALCRIDHHSHEKAVEMSEATVLCLYDNLVRNGVLNPPEQISAN